MRERFVKIRLKKQFDKFQTFKEIMEKEERLILTGVSYIEPNLDVILYFKILEDDNKNK